MHLLSPDTITFGAITVFLLWYVIKSSDKREAWLKKHIEELDESLKQSILTISVIKEMIERRFDIIESKLERRGD